MPNATKCSACHVGDVRRDLAGEWRCLYCGSDDGIPTTDRSPVLGDATTAVDDDDLGGIT